MKYVCKKTSLNTNLKYQYLKNLNVSNVLYPIKNNRKNFSSIRKIDDSVLLNSLAVYPFYNYKEIKTQNHVVNMFYELINLHKVTTYKVKLSQVKSKKKLEEIYNYLEYKFTSLELFVRSVEERPFDEYSIIVLKNYHHLLDIRRDLIELQKKLIIDIKAEKTVEMCFIHNNPKLEHFICVGQERYFISIENGKLGIPSLDVSKFYIENEKYNIDIETMVKEYLDSFNDEFYYNYFCLITLLIYLKSFKVYDKDYITSQNFISVCDDIKKFKSMFLK